MAFTAWLEARQAIYEVDGWVDPGTLRVPWTDFQPELWRLVVVETEELMLTSEPESVSTSKPAAGKLR